MAKAISALAIFVLLSLSTPAQEFSPSIGLTPRSGAPAAIPTPSAPTLTVPADTQAAVTMLSGLHTRISQVDDPVTARLQQAVYVNGQIALPPGSLLNGRVTHVQLAGRMHRPAELGFRFESITLPSGETEPISAVLAYLDKPLPKARLDNEGYLKGTRGFSLKALVGGMAAVGTFGVAKAALAASSAASTLIPVSGAAVLSYAALWPRGNDVNVPPQTPCHIRLNYPVTVRVAW
jgi:hypothetical protein